ncbi:MAG: RND family transporter [Proteobacteria bacterium]|nr:RND family transporter [Pseudomonadota bacterium]
MWEKRLIDGVLRFRIAVLVVVAVVTCVAGYYARQVPFDSDIDIWFLEDDEALLTYKDFLKQFEADETEFIGIFADDIFTKELLEAMDRIIKDAEHAPFVSKVRGLTNTKIITSKGAFHVDIGPLMNQMPHTEEEMEEFRRRALANALIRGRLVSEDGRAAAIIVDLAPEGNSAEGKDAFVKALKEIVRRHLPNGTEWHMAGSPTLDEAFFRYTEEDYVILTPTIIAVVFLCCLFLLRRPLTALVPLSVVVMAVVWTFGLMGLLGMKINVITTCLIALILAVGVADSIHVISEYYRKLMAGLSRDEAVAHSTAELVVPCFFTSATTSAGFLSLLVSELKPVYEFGWLAAVGVSFAFLLSMTFLPAVLRLIPEPKQKVIHHERTGPISRILNRLGRPTKRTSIGVLAVSVALTIVTLFTLTHLKMGANPMNYFHPDDPVRVSTSRIDEGLGGSGSFELLIETEKGGLKEPSVLNRLADLESQLKALPAVTDVLSVLDNLREVRRVLTDGKASSAILPDSRPMAAQLYLLMESDEEFRKWILGDYEVTHMTARVQFSQAESLYAHMDSLIEEIHKKYGDDELRVEVTGYIKLMSEMENYLLESQINSLLLAFIVITFMMFFLLRSVRLALFSMIPNFIPITIGLASMVPLGIALDPGTVMIGSMALGLVVDDTVHFMLRLRNNIATGDIGSAIKHSMIQTGRPIILTSIVLSVGFTILMMGKFSPTVYFGMVSAIVIILALIADLVILPAALIVIAPRIKPHRS